MKSMSVTFCGSGWRNMIKPAGRPRCGWVVWINGKCVFTLEGASRGAGHHPPERRCRCHEQSEGQPVGRGLPDRVHKGRLTVSSDVDPNWPAGLGTLNCRLILERAASHIAATSFIYLWDANNAIPRSWSVINARLLAQTQTVVTSGW